MPATLPGIKPATDRDRAQAGADRPLRATKPQKSLDGLPLLDEGTRDTRDLFTPPPEENKP